MHDASLLERDEEPAAITRAVEGVGRGAGAAADPASLANTLASAADAKIEGKAGLKLCLPPPPK